MHNYVFCRQATYPVKYGMRKRGLDRIRFEVCRPTPPVQRRHLKDLAGNGHMFVRRVQRPSLSKPHRCGLSASVGFSLRLRMSAVSA
jgi:hypothetical protein